MVSPRTPTIAPGALTTLQSVQSWVFDNSASKPPPSDATPLLNNLINQASALAHSYMQRPNLAYHAVEEIRNGTGSSTMLMREYPILGDLTLLTVNGQTIPKRAPLPTTPVVTFNGYGPTGWVNTRPWDGVGPGGPAAIALPGGRFATGWGNVSIQYNAGYAILAEAHTVSTTCQQYTNNPNGPYTGDIGVTYAATGIALTAVAEGSTPGAGQYVPPLDWTDYYQFSTADVGQAVLMSYSYIPSAIDHAVMRWVGEAYRYRSRIGMKSQSLNGAETASFSITAMSTDVIDALQPYKLEIPII